MTNTTTRHTAGITRASRSRILTCCKTQKCKLHSKTSGHRSPISCIF
jgi:hypothetical protein